MPEFIRGLRGSPKGKRSGLDELLNQRKRERALWKPTFSTQAPHDFL